MVTEPSHRPENHRRQVWPPERLIAWGASFGPSVARVVELTLTRYVNPEQGYRACLGLMLYGLGNYFEVLLELPMEPFDPDADDTGPLSGNCTCAAANSACIAPRSKVP